jgi:hypothetical protein
LITAYTKGIRLSAIPKSDARSKINEKLKAPIPKIPVIIKRITKGVLSLVTWPIFESIVVLAEVDLFNVTTSFTKNTKIRTAIVPGINEIKNIALMSMN